MWIVFTFLHAGFMAVANYIDEYLSENSNISKSENFHKKIGGVLLFSCLSACISIIIFGAYVQKLSMTQSHMLLSTISAVPMVATWAGYFYLLQKYSIHQVIPLFGLTSIWLLILELATGSTIGFLPLIGVFFLIYGSYILDTSTFFWKIPSSLLLYMIPLSISYAIVLFLGKILSQQSPVSEIFLFQYIGIFILGVAMIIFVRAYREGFLERMRHQGNTFVIMSTLNETIAQIGFFSSLIAISLAPLATYVQAVGGVQYIFLFIILYFFPLGKRNKLLPMQIFAASMMIGGIFLIEIFK